MTGRAVALALAALGLGGCFLHAAPRPTPAESEWAQAREGATRRALLYDQLKHRATATATHLSLEVREARARRLAAWLGWTPEELEARLSQERSEAALGEEFLLDFYTADPRANDLDAPRSVWRIAVTSGDTDLVATRVTSLERDATVLGLFPYIGPFDVVYRVLLPAPPEGPLAGRPFTLEISSALGRLPLDFGAPPPVAPFRPQEPVPAP